VIEFNVRFGDPEIQPIVLRLRSDLADLLLRVAQGRLEGATVEWDPRPAICVVAASGGYPGPYQTGFAVSGLEEAEALDGEAIKVFAAGLRAGKTGADGKPELLTSGGRVLGLTALGADLASARRLAYQAMEKIRFERMIYRKDVGL
jgi:phosphoribosylamine--glycine ligase